MLTQSRAQEKIDLATDFSISHILRFVSHQLLAESNSMPYLNTTIQIPLGHVIDRWRQDLCKLHYFIIVYV